MLSAPPGRTCSAVAAAAVGVGAQVGGPVAAGAAPLRCGADPPVQRRRRRRHRRRGVQHRLGLAAVPGETLLQSGLVYEAEHLAANVRG